MRLQCKTAFITGGNSGIGLATARMFVAAGAKVAITGRNKDTLAAAANGLGSNILPLVCDVDDMDALEEAVSSAVKALGYLDIVFANAGIGGVTPVGGTKTELFNANLQTNVTSVFMTVQATAPHLNDGASVILSGSVHASLGVPAFSAYAASKAGVRAMTRVLASELAPSGIRVNLVVPGATRTPIWRAMAPTPDALTALEYRLSKTMPLGRMSEAYEIAAAVVYLASDDTKNVSGTEIVIDGGQTGSPSGAPIYRAA